MGYSPSPRGEGRGEGKRRFVPSQRSYFYQRLLSPHPNLLPEERGNIFRARANPRVPLVSPRRSSILSLVGGRELAPTSRAQGNSEPSPTPPRRGALFVPLPGGVGVGRITGSLHLRHWTRIGTMNLGAPASRRRVAVAKLGTRRRYASAPRSGSWRERRTSSAAVPMNFPADAFAATGCKHLPEERFDNSPRLSLRGEIQE